MKMFVFDLHFSFYYYFVLFFFEHPNNRCNNKRKTVRPVGMIQKKSKLQELPGMAGNNNPPTPKRQKKG